MTETLRSVLLREGIVTTLRGINTRAAYLLEATRIPSLYPYTCLLRQLLFEVLDAQMGLC